MKSARHLLQGSGFTIMTLVMLALWWGGLTFYSAVVVPVGAERFGASEQGLVTQEVTRVLNGLGAVAALLTCVQAALHRRIALLVGATVLLASVGLLGALHVHLAGMLDPEHGLIADGDRFYFWHRIYLIVTTVQWGVGGVCLGALPFGGAKPAGEAGH